VPAICLTTLNARYAHASLGLRSLFANLGRLQTQAVIREFTIKESPEVIALKLLEDRPRIIAFGVYIWNTVQTLEVIKALRARMGADVTIVLGGPEVSYEYDQQEICSLANFVVTGEADVTFAKTCELILGGQVPERKIIASEQPNIESLELPYAFYSDDDIRDRVVYVEASRGCPYRCEFCLSSLDKSVRDIPLGKFLAALETLLARGVTQFKFIDRTFNLKVENSSAILNFFLERYRPGMFLHFEMVPDRLPDALREVIKKFPPGALQFEVGVQTLNEEVSRRISRKQNVAKLEENFRFLRDETGVHVHADLIVGLPGETLEAFGVGFNRLLELGPEEIQVGILKRLRGTPIVRHDAEWQMVYSPVAPYEVISTRTLPEVDVMRMKRFAKYWDLISNSGNFAQTSRVLLSLDATAFDSFSKFSDWLYERLQRKHSIALEVLAEHVMQYLVARGFSAGAVGSMLLDDYKNDAGRRTPIFLRDFDVRRSARARSVSEEISALPKRQTRHLKTSLP
jgi:radical SAM superfamily enzyme YgiQ (UPF0313 family)